MARISTYEQDNNITTGDKLLGTDSGGGTRNFVVNDLSSFLAESNSSGNSSSFTFKYKQTNRLAGDMNFTLSSGATFANVTNIKVSKYNYNKTSIAINNALGLLGGKNIIIYDIANRNNFGVYKVDSLQVDTNSSFYNLALTAKTNNGSVADQKIYGIDIFTESGGDLTFAHHQNTASTSWVINHNLGKFPSVSIKFSSSDNVYTNVGAFAGVVYTDENNLTINLAAAESGYAYLN
jgi:hypothetical protein